MNFQLLVKGMRLKTLPAAIVPPAMALAYYYRDYNEPNRYFIYCILLALFIQIATNFYNDAIDAFKGADNNRVGPARLSTQHAVDPKRVMLIGHIFLILALISAVPIFLRGGVPFILLGIVSAYLAYGYTGGPFPLAYLGLGELFVFIFFGLVATVGSYFLMALELDISIFLIGAMVGLQSCTLIAINNYRDRNTDRDVNKRTLATKMSSGAYLKLMDFFLFFPYVILMYFVVFQKLSYVMALLSVGQAHKIRYILKNYNELGDLNQALATAGKQLVLFSILFILGGLWKFPT